ncbi:MAG: hypothetical protein IPQ07_45690 [Myxococcales bacterium]|nr:hypothetical protein [Myxococcales bacterium]
MAIVGELAKVGVMQTDDPAAADGLVRPVSLSPIRGAFRLESSGPGAQEAQRADADGGTGTSAARSRPNGPPVVGGDPVGQVTSRARDPLGQRAPARGDIPCRARANSDPQTALRLRDPVATAGFTGSPRHAPQRTGSSASSMVRCTRRNEASAEGKRGQNPARDRVCVDQDNR